MQNYKKKIIALIKKQLNAEIELSSPPDSSFGDFALPCFPFAKQLKKNPIEIAEELKQKIKKPSFIDRIETKGPYLNFFIDKNTLIKDTIDEITKKKDSYGSSMQGKGKKALIEHTSINPNASPHVGRARNALIGDTIVRLLKFEGYKTEVHYFVNDVGKQIAILVLGAKGKNKVSFNELLNLYVKINNKIKEKPELEKDVFELLHKLEQGDKKVKKEFRDLVDTCIKGQNALFRELNIKYDSFDYESDYLWNKRTEEILAHLKKTKKLFEDDDERLVLNQEEYKLPMKAPFLVLTRADKTSLYPLRDLAYTIDKISSKPQKNIIVLGEDQKLYFQQLKAALDLLGYKAPEALHYSFVLLTDAKMSTRKGNVILLEDFMKEAVSKAKEEISKRHEKVDEKTAKAIAYSAVKYAILKVGNEKNVNFDWSSALSFEGESGPYLQYSYARICSIFRKYKKDVPKNADTSLLVEDIEFELAKLLAEMPETVDHAIKELSPHIIANYVYVVTKKFSEFYHNCPVLNADNEKLKQARLILIDSVKQVIKNCLSLIGIEVIEKM
ncbi:MAG: arginine--tRNA ligase [Nanoarchaeota archaeon]|nr:arginine--tRNA ligase [Nanoarchaeota archaeon]